MKTLLWKHEATLSKSNCIKNNQYMPKSWALTEIYSSCTDCSCENLQMKVYFHLKVALPMLFYKLYLPKILDAAYWNWLTSGQNSRLAVSCSFHGVSRFKTASISYTKLLLEKASSALLHVPWNCSQMPVN